MFRRRPRLPPVPGSEGFFEVFTEPLSMGRAFTPDDDFNNTSGVLNESG